MKVTVVTSNPHKAQEFERLLTPAGFEVQTLGPRARKLAEPVENGTNFEENARIKAVYYATALGETCLADDSGLEVIALGGAPGVFSARYAGHSGPREERDRANREKLTADLRALENVDRQTRLVCALCLANSSGQILFEGRGSVLGTFIDEPKGAHGFGYDTHLLLPDIGKTVAELDPNEWNRRSHRARACAKLVNFLQGS